MTGLVEDINSIVRTRSKVFTLDPAAEREALPAGSGLATAEEQASSGGGGIAPPFTFVSSTTRSETITTSCGEVDIDIITEVTVSDANGDEFSIPFEAPP